MFSIKIRSKIAKISYFHLMRNISYIWNFPGAQQKIREMNKTSRSQNFENM